MELIVATEQEKEIAIKQQLSRLVNQKMESYASIQEASTDTSTSLLLLKKISRGQHDEYTVQQLVYVAEAFGIEVHVQGPETNENI